MATISRPSPLPLLEKDIDEIRHLHRFRTDAFHLRDEGLRRLLEAYLAKERTFQWVTAREEPHDFVHPAIVFWVASRRFAAVVAPDLANKAIKKAGRHLDNLRIGDVFYSSSPRMPTGRSRVPIFQAARICQALLSTPQTIFTRAFWVGYYRITRELHATSEPSWSVGGARIVEGSRPSAFMTGECVRVVSGLARAFEDTGQQARVLHDGLCAISQIASLKRVPRDWKKAEIERTVLATNVSFSRFRARSMLQMSEDPILISGIEKDGVKRGCNDVLIRLADSIQEAVLQANHGLTQAIGEINRFHRIELAKVGPDDVARLRLELPHAIGVRALAAAEDTIDKLRKYNRRLRRHITRPTADEKSAPGSLDELDKMIKVLEKAANRIRRVLVAAREFVNSVLDREAEKERAGLMDIAELAFSAATAAALKRSPQDPRFANVLQHLERSISLDGMFPQTNALDTDSSGYTFLVAGAEIIRAVAQLIEKIDPEPSVEFVEKLMNFFRTTIVDVPDTSDVVGWHNDHPRFPKRALVWTSALAVLALDRIARMLEKRINRRVQRHFTTTLPRPHARSLRLKDLIAPDCGLASFVDEASPSDGDKMQRKPESALLVFERARAHAHGISPLPGQDRPCFSIILFGPPGTGKSTLVRALAASAELPLIEISPSDFLVEGELQFERRTKAVFDALGTLSDTIVLFDEMDDLLQQRSTEPGRETNIYSLLRPSMLTKISSLYAAAKTQRVVYVMNTNLIENMDDAAIREQRFDVKIPLHPPDFLSRCGAIGSALERSANNADPPFDWKTLDSKVLWEAVSKTAGGSMPALAAPGIFLPLRIGKNTPLPRNSIIGPAMNLPGASPFVPPPTEQRFKQLKKRKVEKMTTHQRYAYHRWKTINDWDEAYLNLTRDRHDLTLTAEWLEESLFRVIEVILARLKFKRRS